MAVLDIDSTYVKINFDECAVQGVNVFVVYETYASKSDRDKEKERVIDINKFIENLWDKYAECNEILNNTDGKSDNELVDIGKKQENYFSQIQSFGQCYKIENNSETSVFAKYISDDELNELGFNEVWISDPIVSCGVVKYNAGIYRNEVISKEFYYNRLKECMNKAVLDC